MVMTRLSGISHIGHISSILSYVLSVFVTSWLIFLLFQPQSAFPEAGVLVPISIKDEPDPAILSLDNMQVEIEIDNQFAQVKTLQIFENHTDRILEGKYL